jgi:DNA replication and repair protein RecF
MVFCDRSYIAARCRQRDGEHLVEVALTQRGRKAVRVNGNSIARLGDLMGHMTSVMFSPEDLNLIKEGPSLRRRFMDMTLSQVQNGYFFTLQRYQRALVQRNELLKAIQKQDKARETLPVWEEQLAQNGAALIAFREKFIASLNKKAAEIHQSLTGGKESLELTYECPVRAKGENTKDRILELLERARDKDLRQGVTSVGPHRDDIAVRINAMDARSDASQGQCRTAVLSMKLAELTIMQEITGEAPILLLDDVFSELDGTRREMLQQYIGRVQTFMTCVDMESLALRKGAARIYQVEKGRIWSIK